MDLEVLRVRRERLVQLRDHAGVVAGADHRRHATQLGPRDQVREVDVADAHHRGDRIDLPAGHRLGRRIELRAQRIEERQLGGSRLVGARGRVLEHWPVVAQRHGAARQRAEPARAAQEARGEDVRLAQPVGRAAPVGVVEIVADASIVVQQREPSRAQAQPRAVDAHQQQL